MLRQVKDKSTNEMIKNVYKWSSFAENGTATVPDPALPQHQLTR
jgi:hypothetical protein